MTPKPVAAASAAVKPTSAAPAKKAPVSKAVAVKATAIATPSKKPLPAKSAAVKKVAPVKAPKVPKLKMERDSFTMPKTEYAQFAVLKDRLVKLGQPAKKSELLRAGIMQLAAMTDAALKAAMAKVPTIKTGRPNKK
ncbi:MAG: hypothetical protein LAC66_05820 [Methylotenera sp.]|nr:hypothetical protein [Methylotenera sp.]